MTKSKLARLPDDLAEHIEADVKQQGYPSENDWIIDAFKHFLQCKKPEAYPQMRMIVLRYADKCIKHGGEIAAGEWALWARGVGVICMDCYVSRIGDKALLAKFLKMRELKRVIAELEREADRIADKVEIGQMSEKLERLQAINAEVHKALMEFFKSGVGSEDERQKLDQVLARSDDVFKLVEEIQQFLLARRFKPPEKKKVPSYET